MSKKFDRANYVPKNTTADLQKEVQAVIENLANEVDEARFSDEFLAYVTAKAKFHKYSYNNIFLILRRCPDATNVAGFTTWLRLGRCVRKGETGIPIFQPVTKKEMDGHGNEKVKLFFKVGYVYDVSQTEGEPLPEPPDWKSKEVSAALNYALLQYADSIGVGVEYSDKLEGAMGRSFGGRIELAPESGTETLVHELAHEMLHWGEEKFSRDIMELQAESVGYAVCRYFDLPCEGAPNYIALHGLKPEALKENMDVIADTAKEIIVAVEKFMNLKGEENEVEG